MAISGLGSKAPLIDIKKMSPDVSGLMRVATKESGSGPGDEGKSLTIPPGTEPVPPLPSPATQNGELNRRNTTRFPSALHVEKTE